MRALGLCINLLAFLSTSPAQAYIGPGVGLGTIGVVLGVIASIFLAFLAILWYPVKRLIKRRKSSEKRAEEASTDSK